MSIGDFMANLSGLSESDAQLFQMDHIEINEKLRTISASFSTDTFKASSLHQPKLIASTPFLGGANLPSDSTHSVGHALYQELLSLLKLMDYSFAAVVVSDYDLAKACTEVHQRISVLTLEIEKLRILASKTFLKPDSHLHVSLCHNAKFEIERKRSLERSVYEHIALTSPMKGSSATAAQPKTRSKAPLEEVMIDETHATIRRYDEETKRLCDECIYNLNTAYTEKTTKYNTDFEATEAAKLNLALKELELKKETSLYALLVLHQSTSSSIAVKLKTAMSKHNELRRNMITTVVIPTSLRVVNCAFTDADLPGLFHILFKDYNKATVIDLARAVLHLVSFKADAATAATQPATATKDISDIQQEWYRKGYFPMLTQDVFFAMGLANSFPLHSKPREIAIENVEKEINAQQDKTSRFLGDPMPVFTAVKSALADYERMMTFANGSSTSSKAADPPRRQIPYQQRSRIYGTEQAASATDTSELFHREVLPSENKMFPHAVHGHDFRYVAVNKREKVCAQCCAPKPVPCRPPARPGAVPNFCYSYECRKCKYFGHSDKNCHQSHKVDGTPVA